jgi:hypothetical protein
MADLSGFPYAEVRFGVDGSPIDADERNAALDLAAGGATDLLVVSHGWNNDMADARSLYARVAASMRDVVDASPPDGYDDRALAVIGVLWPSKRFADTDLIPGGAAAVGGGAGADDIRREIDELAEFLDRDDASQPLKQAKDLVDDLGDDAGAQRAFAELIRQAIAGVPVDDEDASAEFFDQDGAALMERLGRPVFVGAPPPGSMATTGGALGLGDVLSGAFRAARNLLNVATYYEMKARAGAVGGSGVADLLADARKASADLRIHLAGHSFGARVVTAAAAAGDGALPIASMSLLQAAFSHYGFADDWEPGKDGLFRPVVLTHRISGPTIITHTQNDKAVGIAYAIASRIAGQVAAAIGDKTDKYGGLGRNGAQKTPEAVDQELLAAGASGYDLRAGRLHNLLADAFVDSHSDIDGREVAYGVLSAVAAT